MGILEERAAVASGSPWDRGHDEAWPLYVFSIAIGNGSKLMERRAAVASAGTGHMATTERGPPDQSKTCARHANNFRR